MQKDRNLSIDLIKIIAMFGVMCLHSTYSYKIPGHQQSVRLLEYGLVFHIS